MKTLLIAIIIILMANVGLSSDSLYRRRQLNKIHTLPNGKRVSGWNRIGASMGGSKSSSKATNKPTNKAEKLKQEKKNLILYGTRAPIGGLNKIKKGITNPILKRARKRNSLITERFRKKNSLIVEGAKRKDYEQRNND